MEIRLLTDAGEKDPESYDADHYLRHVLSDGIKKDSDIYGNSFLMKNFRRSRSHFLLL